MTHWKIALGTAAALMMVVPAAAADRFGVIAHITAKPGQRDAMLDILKGAAGTMKGNISFVLAKDGKNPDGIWVTEIWESQEAHDAVLTTDAFKATMGKATPLMASMDQNEHTWPVAGSGF